MTQFVIANTDTVASKVLDGEAILINLENGIYYSFNPVAGLIWLSAAEGVSATEASEHISRHFFISPEVAANDVQRFLDSLRVEGLARLTETRLPATTVFPDLPADKPAYTPPVFEKFTDMMEMFALDPPLPGLVRK